MHPEGTEYVVRKGAKGWVVEAHRPGEQAPYAAHPGYLTTEAEAEALAASKRQESLRRMGGPDA